MRIKLDQNTCMIACTVIIKQFLYFTENEVPIFNNKTNDTNRQCTQENIKKIPREYEQLEYQ